MSETGPIVIPSCEFHHTAYPVSDIDVAIGQWCRHFGASVDLPPTLVTADRVMVAFLGCAGGRIELVQWLAPPARKPVTGRPDHVCFLCDDLDSRLAAIRDEGGILAREPVPSEAFGMRRMCFVVYPDIGLVELVERQLQT